MTIRNLEELTAALVNQINNEEIETTLTAHEIAHHAFMLTQYDKYGFVSYDEMKDYIIRELMDEPSIDEINEYLLANAYEEYFMELNDETLDEMLYDYKPSEIVCKIAAGEFRWSDDYVSFNGYGNLQSYSKAEIADLYGEDTKKYLLNNELFTPEIQEIADNSNIIIKKCNELIAAGY